MELKEFRTECARLYEWLTGEGSGRMFYLDGQLGYGISTNCDKLIIWEDDGGERTEGLTLHADDIERMGFDADEYKYKIVDTTGGEWEIEAYDLQRVDFPNIKDC